VAAFDAGRPLEARGCSGFDLPAGRVDVRGVPAALAIEHLRLAAAPTSGLVLPGQGGRVLRQGHGDDGRRDGVVVHLDGPSWLVLDESYNKGWRARCNGRDLGAPKPIEGYANGWLVEPGCSRVEFRYSPDNTLRLAYLLSIFGIPFLVVAVVRRRRPGYTNLARLTDPDPVRPLDLLTAAGVAVAGAAAVALVFTPIAGAVAYPVFIGLLWRGARVRRLIEGATAALVIGAPVAYLLAGWGTARWFAAGALSLLAYALVRTLMAARAP
jgi:arabinofuranan 3-O-arabinosyltransferase